VSAATIFLVRHASHDRLGRTLCGRSPGVTLGEAGLAEAARTAERLRGEGLHRVYTSPLERAVATASPIAAAAGVPVEPAEELHELDYGAWSGCSFEELDRDPGWQAWNRDKAHVRPPAGETLIELQCRVARWLDFARERHGGERIVAVSHGEPIKAALVWVLGAPFDALARFEVEPASVSVVVGGAWGFKVLAMNEAVR
jgi:probable phosphoglycerate mutase